MADTITVFKGDGIGPEITDSVLRILDAAGADLNYEVFNVGAAEYEAHGELIPKDPHFIKVPYYNSFRKGLPFFKCYFKKEI